MARTPTVKLLVLLLPLLVSACGDDAGPAVTGPDPFAAQPDEGAGLVDVSSDLNAVLENGALPGACEAWEADPADRRKKLLCGKYLFFYGAFDQVGPPDVLFTTFIENFPALIGPGFSQLGMIADPYAPNGLPIGLGYGASLGDVPTVSYTCASCHFAQLPDGRYAVGAPNHAYDYGAQMLLFLTLLPLMTGDEPAEHHPAAVARMQPFLDHIEANPDVLSAVFGDLAPIAGMGGGMGPSVDAEVEGQYASWPTGVMDAVLAPLYLDDEVHIATKIHSLWGLPRRAEAVAAGAPHMMIGWAGGSLDLQSFFLGFLQLGDAPLAEWPAARLEPLEDYVHSLRAPADPATPDAAQVARGATLFAAECQDCHGGPRGMGVKVYEPAEIGTDPAVARMMDGDLDGNFCCDYEPVPGEAPTHGVKSPRLVGLWAMSRFLHNGAVGSLDALLCLDGPRGSVTEAPHGDGGHTYGCDWPEADRRAMLAFLRSH